MKIQFAVFCVVLPCSVVVGYLSFGRPFCLNIQCWSAERLKMEAARSSEMTISNHHTTRRNNPDTRARARFISYLQWSHYYSFPCLIQLPLREQATVRLISSCQQCNLNLVRSPHRARCHDHKGRMEESAAMQPVPVPGDL